MTPLPQKVLDLAAEHRLGEFQRAHGSRSEYRRALLWLALLSPIALPALPAAVYALVLGSYWLGGAGVPAALIFLTGYWLVLSGGALRGGGQTFYLFENGFVHTVRRSARAWPWEGLRSVTVAGGRRRNWRLTAVRADGRKVSFGTELPGAREFGEIVALRSAAGVTASLQTRVAAGERVEVGPFTIDRTGVEKDGVRIAWPEVEEAGVGNGLVFVRRADGRRGLGALANGVPNAIAFAELCRRTRDEALRRDGADGEDRASGPGEEVRTDRAADRDGKERAEPAVRHEAA